MAASASEVGFGVFHPKATAQTYFAQVFSTIPRGTTLASLVQLEEMQKISGGGGTAVHSVTLGGEDSVEGEDAEELLALMHTGGVAKKAVNGFGASTTGGNAISGAEPVDVKDGEDNQRVEGGHQADKHTNNLKEAGVGTEEGTIAGGEEDEDEEAGDALKFLQGSGLVKKEEVPTKLENTTPVKDAGVLGPAGDQVALGGEDPYFGLFDDVDTVHRGRCRLFHQQKGFGFIEPTPLRRPAKMPLGAKFPDLYFAREDIALSGNARTAWEEGKEKGQELRGAGALHSLCVEEEIEFKVVLHNGSRGGGGEGEDELYGNTEESEMMEGNGAGGKKYKAVEITGPNRGPVRAHQPANRFRGIIRHWNSSQEYGFIAPNTGGRDVFFHSSAVFWGVPRSLRVVELGFVVEYAMVRQKSTRDRDGKQVALAVSDSNFAGLDPAIVPKSTNAAIRKEQERKRRRDDDPDGDNPNRTHGDGSGPNRGGGGGRTNADAPRKDELIVAGEEDTYATW